MTATHSSRESPTVRVHQKKRSSGGSVGGKAQGNGEDRSIQQKRTFIDKSFLKETEETEGLWQRPRGVPEAMKCGPFGHGSCASMQRVRTSTQVQGCGGHAGCLEER